MEVLKGSDDSCVDSDGIQHEDETVLAVGEAGDITIAEEEGQSGDGESEWFMKNWPYEALGDDVVLMNALHDKPDELALAYTTCGNQSQTENKYSAAALIIPVPSATRHPSAVRRDSV